MDELVTDNEPAEDALPAEEMTPAEDASSTDELASTDVEQDVPEDDPTEVEEPTEVTDSQSEETEKAPTKTVYTYVDDTIKVTATVDDPAAAPDDAELRVSAIDPKNCQYAAYMAALNNSVSENPYNEGNTLLYDVAFVVTVDGETIEVESTEGSVKVKFEFKDQQLTQDIDAERAADVEVTHLPEVDGSIEAEPLETIASDTNNITVTTDSFSVFAFSYTVDFTYDGYVYSFPGRGSYALTDVLAALGIEGAADSATLSLVEGVAIEGDLYLT